MPDWERVIKALDHHRSTSVCDGCPYENEVDTIQGYCPIYDDAISLLREQEPVKPKTDGTSIYDVDGHIVCGACGGNLGMPEVFKFCPWCGRKVDWNA